MYNTCERNKTCSIESTIFCIWILGFLANCLENQSNQPRDFLPPYHTFPPHRWEITTSLQTDVIKCCGQILTSAKAPSTQNLGHEDFAAMLYIQALNPPDLPRTKSVLASTRAMPHCQHPTFAHPARTFSYVFYLFHSFSTCGIQSLARVANLLAWRSPSRQQDVAVPSGWLFLKQQQRQGKLDQWQGMALLSCIIVTRISVVFWGVTP